MNNVSLGRECLSSSTPISGERLAYSVADAVAASGIGRTTLFALMSSGELPFVKLGNRTLIRSTDLEGLLHRHLVQPSRPMDKRAPAA